MAISTSYPKGIPIEDSDFFVGTKGSNNRTVNYSAQGIADYLNINAKISIAGQLSFKFSPVPNLSKTISFDGGGGNNTAFSAITQLVVSSTDLSGSDITIFLGYLNDRQILLAKQNEPNSFGHYSITGYTQIGVTNFYTLDLDFIGGNGVIEEFQYYDMVSFGSSGSGTTPTLQEVTDEGNETDNNIISKYGSYKGILTPFGLTIENLDPLDSNFINYLGMVRQSNLGQQELIFDNVTTAGSITIPNATGTLALLSDIPAAGVTSVGLTMPSAFSVTNSPITSSGDIAVTGAGSVSQYVRGDGTLANFPASTGGGASLSFYLNGSVSQGTIGGVAFREMDRTPILGAGTDFTINANGYIQSFITDAGVPNQLEIPAGNWNFETYFSVSSGGGSPSFYVELYKWNGATLSLIASNSASPEGITNGTAIDAYFSALAVPQTTLLATDRLAIRIYVAHSGRTITLHTEDNHLCQVITTFSTGITALNGLTAQVQNLAVGTSGTDFAISSTSATHTFNLPTASATNRGALSSTDWSTFNGKQPKDEFTGATLITSADLLTLANTNALVIGQVYKVEETKFYNSLATIYVYVKATSVNTIDEENAIAEFYDPDYSTYGIYDTTLTYDTPDRVIWGGLLWEAQLIVLPGANINNYELDGVDFSIVTTPALYNVVMENVSYSIEFEMIYSRRNHYCNFTCDPDILLIGNVKIRNMAWGYYYNSGTSKGLRGINCLNSDFNIINSNNILLTEITLINSFVAVGNSRTLDDLVFANSGTFASPNTITSNISSRFFANTMTATVGGLVPTPPNNTTTFLRGDGTFAAPAGGGSSQVKLSAQTLAFASWVLVGNFYEYTFANANIVSTGFVNFTPNNASINEVSTCRMLPQIDAAAGTCKFYSLFPPQTNIVGEIVIFIL